MLFSDTGDERMINILRTKKNMEGNSCDLLQDNCLEWLRKAFKSQYHGQDMEWLKVVKLCSVAVGHQHFGGPCCLHHQSQGLHCEDWDCTVFQNIGILPQGDTASQPRRPQLESSLLLKSQILNEKGTINIWVTEALLHDWYEVVWWTYPRHL